MASKNEMIVNTTDGEMKICVMDITPAKAAKLLSLNTNNRALRRNRIDVYTTEMLQENWKSNGVPIIIGNDGELKDGQHRLTACVKSGKTMKNAIVIYLPRSQANCYDIGASRNAKDVAAFLGLDNEPFFRSLGIFSVVNLALDGKDVGKCYSKIRLINEMQKHKDACEFVYRRIYCHGDAQKSRLRKSGLSAAIFNAYLNGYDREKLERFCEVLTNGIVKDDAEIPIIKLRDIVFGQLSKNGVSRTLLYFQTQATLYAYANNIPLVKLEKANQEYYIYPKD